MLKKKLSRPHPALGLWGTFVGAVDEVPSKKIAPGERVQIVGKASDADGLTVRTRRGTTDMLWPDEIRDIRRAP